MMSDDAARMLTELLASAKLSAETRAELEGFARAQQAGHLEGDDAAYIAALHRRLLGVANDDERPAVAALDDADLFDDDDRLAIVIARFDQLYHPQRGNSTAGDKASRDAIHAEFSAVLQELARR